MSWKETCAMRERMQFVIDSESGLYSMSELCRRYGISRPCGYKWLERFSEEGVEGLREKSRAPRNCPHRLDGEREEVIVALRRAHPQWGPRKLLVTLQGEHPDTIWPAASTVGDLLKRHGLTISRRTRHKATPSQHPFGACDGPNQVWCADFKGWFRTQDGMRCDPFTLTDAYSRYLLRCQICGHTGHDAVRGIMEAVFREYGLPGAIRTDNGAPFASTGLGGLSRLSVWYLRLGIVPERIRPGNPQENGRHERFHRTLKEATAKPPAASLRAQQQAFDAFRREYNEERPHEALFQQRPSAIYVCSARTYPARLPQPAYPDGMQVRKIDGGRVTVNTERVFLSKVLEDEWVGLFKLDSRYWLAYFSTALLGVLDLKRQRVLRIEHAAKRIPDLSAAISNVLAQKVPPLGEGSI